MKLCKECRHVRLHAGHPGWTLSDDEGWGKAQCALVTRVSLITGAEDFEFCSYERGALGQCGPEGKHWQPRMETKT